MNQPLDVFLAAQACIGPQVSSPNPREQVFPLLLNPMPASRTFEAAWLVLPADFPSGSAIIRLSRDAVLRIPHVEYDGKVCFDGDPGPASGLAPEDRIVHTLWQFNETFLTPWLSGALDGHFEDETRSYWEIFVRRHKSKVDPIKRVYTVDGRPPSPAITEAWLVLPDRTLVVGGNKGLEDRLIASLGPRARQRLRVLVADIPIEFPWAPTSWPTSIEQIELLLNSWLDSTPLRRFATHLRHHRVVLFRAPQCTYAYLLPGGPPTVVERGKTKRAHRARSLLPLRAERFDPSWTYGRDQVPAVEPRQDQHVLVLGAGALASPVIDQLARAGVGQISVVDPQSLAAPNVGRHLLGAESVEEWKAVSVARRVEASNPACRVQPFVEDVETWLTKQSLKAIDVILDLTGEPGVRYAVEQARHQNPTPLLIAWMEPFVAAAHACSLPADQMWLRDGLDPLLDLQAVRWPEDVMLREPGCNSSFQSYTSSQAGYAVSLVAETALALLDTQVDRASIRSWVRGQKFLDKHRAGLRLEPWAFSAVSFDGILLERDWYE
ncbi:MAG TPA: ThiF family adenylyltransferase [Burkholderiaceae bacterium]|nr:ThiF family adenylyltransferase [Burkholderiaceae bacterium]